MIIEFVDLASMAEPGEPDKVIFIHVDFEKDGRKQINDMSSTLAKLFPNFTVLRVPRGEPCQTNTTMPKIAMANRVNTDLMDAIKVLCRHQRSGAIIPMSDVHMTAIADALKNGDLVYL